MFRRRLLIQNQFFITLLTGAVILLVVIPPTRPPSRGDELLFEAKQRNIDTQVWLKLEKVNLSLDQLLQGPSRITVKLSADNPELVEHVRKHILISPSKLPYNLEEPDKESWDQGQGDLIYGPLKQQSGFFVEAGAFNGEYLSNSLRLEKHLGWSGLLVEANTKQFDIMKTKHRKAWCANACLSTNPYPMQVTFEQNDVFGKIIEFPGEEEGIGSGSGSGSNHAKQNIQCVPLLTFMLALNQTTIDYFSLDVEGSELDVLKTIPFDKLDIKFLSVEVNHVPEGVQAVIDFMKSHSYKVHGTYKQDGWIIDVMFIK